MVARNRVAVQYLFLGMSAADSQWLLLVDQQRLISLCKVEVITTL